VNGIVAIQGRVTVDNSAEMRAALLESIRSPHSLDPASPLAVVRAMGGDAPPVFVVACEPQTLGGDEGAMGLSPPVAAAIEPAIGAVEKPVQRLHNEARSV
jgi:Ni,Fe-hydrogenase maturation factor